MLQLQSKSFFFNFQKLICARWARTYPDRLVHFNIRKSSLSSVKVAAGCLPVSLSVTADRFSVCLFLCAFSHQMFPHGIQSESSECHLQPNVCFIAVD